RGQHPRAAGRRSRRQTTSSGGGGAKKSGLSQHRTPSCVSRDCTAECAASARRRAQTSRRVESTSATQRRARVTLPGHRQTGAAPVLFQRRLGNRVTGDYFTTSREIAAQARVAAAANRSDSIDQYRTILARRFAKTLA